MIEHKQFLESLCCVRCRKQLRHKSLHFGYCLSLMQVFTYRTLTGVLSALVVCIRHVLEASVLVPEKALDNLYYHRFITVLVLNTLTGIIFRVHSVSQWPNLRHLDESLGGAEGQLEAVSFKKATKGRPMGRGSGGCNT